MSAADISPAMTGSAAGGDRTCLVQGCDAAATTHLPICNDHWKGLPGRLRSKLSLSFRDTPVRREAFARAAEMLGGRVQ